MRCVPSDGTKLIVQTSLSIIFPATLVGFVSEENTAVTWSVLGRCLQASPWPTLLHTDAAAHNGVQRRVSYGLMLQTAIVVLVSVAAIVTPLGLYQPIELGGQELNAFQFVKDDSPFGYGTPARLGGPFTRDCGGAAKAPCPGAWRNETCVQEGLGERCTVVDSRAIPDIWRSTFRDGASQVSESVSSIFDIQWRSQVNASDPYGSEGWYLKSGYRQIDLVTLDPAIRLVDGLIVDAQNGGIGFRNHTVPVPVHEYGSTWSEDILFIEPETQCVDLNVTFDFQLSLLDTTRFVVRDLALTDRGGFSALSRTSPNLSLPKHSNGQGPLDLRERAYKAAWANNFLTLVYFNATDPNPNNITRLDVNPGMAFPSDPPVRDINKTICVTDKPSAFAIEYQAIQSSLYYGGYLRMPRNESDPTDNPHGIRMNQFHHVCTSLDAPTT